MALQMVRSWTRPVTSRAAAKMVIGATALSLIGGFLGSREAQAHRRDFPYTYDWKQPSEGEKELEWHTRYRGRDNTLQQQLEFEYGITDRWLVAPYIVFQRNPGGSLRYDEWKIQTRYQLTKYKTGKILPSVYLEYIDPRTGPSEIEAKLILSRFDKSGGNVSLNLISERALESGAEYENIYSLGYVRPLSRDRKSFLGKRGARGGVEWIHNLESKRINAGPVLNFALSKSVWVTSHYLFPVNKRGGNQGEFRMIVEYEWF